MKKIKNKWLNLKKSNNNEISFILANRLKDKLEKLLVFFDKKVATIRTLQWERLERYLEVLEYFHYALLKGQINCENIIENTDSQTNNTGHIRGLFGDIIFRWISSILLYQKIQLLTLYIRIIHQLTQDLWIHRWKCLMI